MASAGTTTATISAFTIALFGMEQCTIQVPGQEITVVTATPTPTPTPAPTPTATPTPLPTGDLVQVGATVGFVGDGIMSASAASGERNAPEWFLAMMGGRLQPVPAWNLSQSGTSIYSAAGNYAWAAVAIEAMASQKPDVAIFGSIGHNDNVLGVDPANSQPLADWKSALDRYIAANDQAKLIPVIGTAPSALAAQAVVDPGYTSTRRQRAWAAMAEYVAAKGDPRLVFVDVSSIDPNAWSPAGDIARVHPDDRGGSALARLIFNAVSPRVASATPTEIQAMIDAQTYPLMGPQLDPDRSLLGSGGLLANVLGTLPTSKSITNATGAGVTTAVAASVAARQKIVVNFSGAPTTTANVQVVDKTNLSVAVTPGQYVMHAWSVKFPASFGLTRFGFDWGSLATAFGGSSPATATTLSGNIPAGLDTVVMFLSRPTFGSSAPSAKRVWGFRFAAGVPLAGTLELDQPAAWVVSNRMRHRPVYLGDLKPVGGLPAFGANLRMRLTGTVSSTAGGTVRFEPGLWAPAGLTEADYRWRQVWDCPNADATLASCTKIAEVAGSTWLVPIPAGLARGRILYPRLVTSNGVGDEAAAVGSGTLTVQ